MLSYWDQNSLLDYDFLIAGGGIVGLSTAISILEKKPKARVLVVERGLLPTGASTRNAGFACFGSLTELLEDEEKIGADEMLHLASMRWHGLQLLLARLGEEAMDYRNYGGYEILGPEGEAALEKMPHINDILFDYFKQEVFFPAHDEIASLGFRKDAIRFLIRNPLEGQIDTGKMMRSLWQRYLKMGGQMITGAEVMQWEDGGAKVSMRVKNPLGEAITFSGKHLAVCTNAFTRKLLPEIELAPGRGQVLITEPIPGLPFKGCFHYQEGYYYFRNLGERIIFGGGRNLDFEAETTTEPGLTPGVQDHLEDMLKSWIIPGKPFRIAHRWSGIMAFGPDKRPLMHNLSPNVILGVRLGGMGVAIGSYLGAELAKECCA
ncbi:MAG: FAD-dependent oxidoreductase [Bacteroidota bacterium]